MTTFFTPTRKRAALLTACLLTLLLLVSINTAQSAQAQTAADCPTDTFMDVASYNQTQNYAQPTLAVSCDGTTMHVSSNGITNFTFSATTPNALEVQNYNWAIPQTPVYSATTTDIPLLGAAGIVVNGLPIFGPNEAPTHGYGDPYLDEILDYCNGHTAQGGTYHFHARPDCLWTSIEGQVGLVIGYAFDGFPILAPYINTAEGVIEVQSSWARTADVTNAWEAHEYIPGLSILDECNGMLLDDGSYAYFATDTFPYFMGCYHGEVSGGGQGNAAGGAAGGAPTQPTGTQPQQDNQPRQGQGRSQPPADRPQRGGGIFGGFFGGGRP